MRTALVLTLILACGVLVIIWVFVGRFKRCPANKILVIYGKTGKGAANCVHGGAAFIWPVLQSYEWLDLEPFVVPIELTSALSQENIRVSVPTTVTAAISTRGRSHAKRCDTSSRPDYGGRKEAGSGHNTGPNESCYRYHADRGHQQGSAGVHVES